MEKQQQQQKGVHRNIIDKYYTKNTTVDICLQFIKTYVDIDMKEDLVIEPSAGNGAFIEGIKTLSLHHLFYDIQPENDEILQQDYLLWNYKETIILQNYRKIHIIGNPPFGRQSSLSIQFIKKSCEYCHSFSFILPKSFKKESLKKKIPLHFQLLFEYDLEDSSFLVEGKEHTVPCVFQIWVKTDTIRIPTEKNTPIHYIFVKKEQTPDISFRRVGVNAGKIDTNITDKSVQSHYFIKFTNDKHTKENIECLKNIRFEFNNTVGPKSISKQELIEQFNRYI